MLDKKHQHGFLRIRVAGLVLFSAFVFLQAGRADSQDFCSDCIELSSEVDACESCSDCGACNCLLHRQKLTGDWLGRRHCLAEQGITFDADITQFYMGVTSGGRERDFRYSGHGDYVLNIDSGKLGGPQGLFVKLRAEHRFGEPLSGATGALLSSNVVADLPVADSEEIYLTNVLFTQMFSETFGVFAGKLDTFDGDPNAFAHGRGKDQFSNIAFVITPIGLRTVVYSTLGAGFVILREGEPLFTFTILNSKDTTRTSGFSELFANGAVLTAELRLPTAFMGLPGHQLFGGTWSSKEYVSIGQDPRIVLPNIPIANQKESWSLYWNFDQYLFVDSCDPLRGWGVFGRAGIADNDTNPFESFLSFGIGGSSMIPCRTADTFGVGWYYAETSSELNPVLAGILGNIKDGQGVELFYNAAATPWLNITADMQVIMPSRQTIDTALVFGLRAKMNF